MQGQKWRMFRREREREREGIEGGEERETETEWNNLCCTRLACCLAMVLTVPQVTSQGEAAPKPLHLSLGAPLDMTRAFSVEASGRA